MAISSSSSKRFHKVLHLRPFLLFRKATFTSPLPFWAGRQFIKVFMGGGDVERVRRAVAVELEHPPPELSAVEEPYRKIVEEVATYVAERGRLEGEKYSELYRRFRKLTPCPPS